MFWSWGCRCQWGLGFKNFFSESWILNPENFAKFAKFLGFKIQDSRFSEKVLESKSLDLGVVDISEGLDSRTFSQNLESWILNPENFAKFAQFLGFKIQDNSWGYWNSIMYIYIYTHIHIYIYMAPPTPKMSVFFGGVPYIYIYIFIY